VRQELPKSLMNNGYIELHEDLDHSDVGGEELITFRIYNHGVSCLAFERFEAL